MDDDWSDTLEDLVQAVIEDFDAFNVGEAVTHIPVGRWEEFAEAVDRLRDLRDEPNAASHTVDMFARVNKGNVITRASDGGYYLAESVCALWEHLKAADSKETKKEVG